MNTKGLMIACGVLLLSNPTWARIGLGIQFHYRIVDEQGSPISNANVEMSFVGLIDEKDPWKGQNDLNMKGMTDSQGRWSVSGVTMNDPAVSVKKEGFYPSGKRYTLVEQDTTLARWKPYERNETLVLRKIVNPIPMYAWNMGLMKYPAGTNEWLGFDMVLAEWMPPHGKGETEDVRFHVWRSANGYDQTIPAEVLTVRFMGNKNGVCGINDKDISNQSTFKFPYKAPRDGYSETEFRLERRLVKYEFETKTNTGTTNCFFRARSRVDKDGNIIDGLYGKIKGPLKVEGGKGIRIYMVYYLNPTPNDLNIEFDIKQNLIHKKDIRVAVPLP